jgi:hypothetical protein
MPIPGEGAAMNPKARLKNRKSTKATYQPLPLNFLLGCSEGSLASFELTRLSEVANLRSELHAVLDRLLVSVNLEASRSVRFTTLHPVRGLPGRDVQAEFSLLLGWPPVRCKHALDQILDH